MESDTVENGSPASLSNVPLADDCPECGGELYLKPESRFRSIGERDIAVCSKCKKEFKY